MRNIVDIAGPHKQTHSVSIFLWVVAAVLYITGAGNALAATIYTDRAAFEAALTSGTVSTETFESSDTFGDADASRYPPADGRTVYNKLTDFSLRATPAAIKIMGGALTNDPGSHNTTPGGSKFLYLDTDNPIGLPPPVGSTTDILMNRPVEAFGFDYTGVFEPGSTFTVTIGGDVFDLALNRPKEGDPEFWGVTGLGSFSEITLMTSLDSGYGVDDVTFQSVVPLPPAIWLFGSGLVGLAGSAFRRRARGRNRS